MTMKNETEKIKEKSAKKICGIIMPITGCTYKDTEYSATHWASMRKFLEDAIADAGFEPRVVWDDKSQSIIQGRIVNNIAEFDLAICVICGMNHNVLIELGLRLMTNKPVLVIHDDNNMPLPFDVNSLESFKMPVPTCVDYVDYQNLGLQIKNTLPKMADLGYKTFLSYFKQVVPKDANKINEVELAQFMNETRSAIQDIRSTVIARQTSQEDRDRAHIVYQKADEAVVLANYIGEYHELESRYVVVRSNPNSIKEEYEDLRRSIEGLFSRYREDSRVHDVALYEKISGLCRNIRRTMRLKFLE